jgi:hypothetical protein
VGAGDPEAPRWIVGTQPATVLAIHGAKFSVPSGQKLFVAQGAVKAGDLSDSSACVIAWQTQGGSPVQHEALPFGGRQ